MMARMFGLGDLSITSAGIPSAITKTTFWANVLQVSVRNTNAGISVLIRIVEEYNGNIIHKRQH
jgi:hypothetical protein